MLPYRISPPSPRRMSLLQSQKCAQTAKVKLQWLGALSITGTKHFAQYVGTGSCCVMSANMGSHHLPAITMGQLILADTIRLTAARRREKSMLEICPMTLKEANAFVEQHHRHHKPVVGHKFSIGCTDGEKIVGVAIVGRPVSRYLDDGWTLEVNRLCTDGTRNACSMLYAAAWRAARAMGYHKLVTYILDTESGTSLKAAGWKCVGQAGGLRWTGKRRPEVDLYPAQMKIKFEIGDGKRPPEGEEDT